MSKFAVIFSMLIMKFTDPAMAQFGVHAGAALGGTTFTDFFSFASESNTFKKDVGFTGGLFYRYQAVGSKFAIQPELNWLKKGGRKELNLVASIFDWEYDFDLDYLEIPVYFLYSSGYRSGFYGGIGPAFNFGFSGTKIVSLVSLPDYAEEVEMKFGKNEDLRSFHLGVNAMAGYQLGNGIAINVFFSQSLTNSAPKWAENSKVSFFNYGLRVGYMLNTGK